MGPSDEPHLDLLRQLRTSMYLQHAWTARSWQADDGLHPAAAALLAELAAIGESRPSTLAKRRMVDVSVVSRQIAQLTAAGLIERRPAPEDGRVALVQVSETGYAELRRWRRTHVDFLRTALADWDDSAVGALASGLAELNDNLRAVLGANDCVPPRQPSAAGQ